ncbi:unnamed protein product [Scytosiphon promiscuus]
MISRLFFGFEGYVLLAFVTVKALVLWSISRISTGAMNVPGVCGVLDRYLPPHSAADAGSAPPRPASVGVVPAPPDIIDCQPGLMWRLVEDASVWIPPCAVGGRAIVVFSNPTEAMCVMLGLVWWWMFYSHDASWNGPPSAPPGTPAHRSAGSARGCLAEAALSAIVSAHAVMAMGTCSTASETGRQFFVLVSTLCGAKLGLYHLVNPSYSQRAVNDIVDRSNGNEPVRHDGTFSLGQHRVDLFEYADMAAFGRIYASALMVIVWGVLAALCLSGGTGALGGLIGLPLTVRVLSSIVEYRGVLERPNLEDVCDLRPWHRVVRCFLLLSCLAYTGLLCFSPGPFAWRGALIVTHVTRYMNLLVSLRDRHWSGVNAASVGVEHPSKRV